MNKKLILGIIGVLMLLITLQSTLSFGNTTTTLYYSFDTSKVSGTNVIDLVNFKNATITGSGYSTSGTGKIGQEYSSTNGTARVLSSWNPSSVSNHNTYSYCMWLKVNGTQESGDVAFQTKSNDNGLLVGGMTSFCGKEKYCAFVYTSNYKFVASQTLIDTGGNVSTFICVTLNNATRNISIYVNGVFENSTATGSDPLSVDDLGLGATNSGTTSLKGSIDEFSYFQDYVLSAQNISELYNSGTGCQYPYTSCTNVTSNATYVNITFYSQTPVDLTSTSMFSTRLNITYNDTQTELNSSYPYLNFTITNGNIYINGTLQNNYDKIGYSYNNSQFYNFFPSDNKVLPGTYNINETLIENTAHNTFILSGTNDYAKIELLNVNSSSSFSYFEVMLNTTGVNPSNIYYCNNTYSSGSPSTNANCVLLSSFSSSKYNHTHTGGFSSHNVFSLPIVNGKIGLVSVTNTSYFLIRGTISTNSAFLSYINNYSRNTTYAISSNNGATWTYQTTTPDAHLHQFNSNTAFTYQGCTKNSTTVLECTNFTSDTLDISPLPPLPPSINRPLNSDNFNQYINISWNSSIPSVSTSISYYNITLLNSDGSFNQTLIGNAGNVSYYYWNTYNYNLSVPNNYRIKIFSFNNYNQSSFVISDNFSINSNGLLNISAQTYTGTLLTEYTINSFDYVTNTTTSTIVISGNSSLKTEEVNLGGCAYTTDGVVPLQLLNTWIPSDYNVNVTTASLYINTGYAYTVYGMLNFIYSDGSEMNTTTRSLYHTGGYYLENNPDTTKYVSRINVYGGVYGTCYSGITTELVNITYYYPTSGTFNAQIPSIKGRVYNVNIVAPGYSYIGADVNLTQNQTYLNYMFTLFLSNWFNLSIYDETNNQIINNETFNIKLISDIYANNYTTTNGYLNITLLLPGEYQIIYSGINGSSSYIYPRSYYTTLINNSKQDIRLYAVNDGISSYLVPTVIDSNELKVENATIQLIRGQIEGTSYNGYIVEMTRTDAEGRGLLKVEPNNVYYKFIVTSSKGSLITNYFKLTSSTITLQVGIDNEEIQFIKDMNNIIYVLSFNNVTNQFVATYTDSTNTITEANLKVVKRDQYGVTSTVSDQTLTATSGSFGYIVTDMNSSQYTATLSFTNGEQTSYRKVEKSFDDSPRNYGLFGVLFTIFLVLIFVSMAGNNAEIAIIGSIVGILIMGFVGFIFQEWLAIGGIIIVGMVLIYKMNRQ